jgi:hypothetical protein
MFSSSIIDGILAEWQKMPGTKKELPAREELQQLLTTAFLLSLQGEEERAVRTRLMSFSREAADTGRFNPLNTIAIFRGDHLLTVDWLGKIASAFDPATTAICVFQDEADPSQLRAWGTVHTNRKGKTPFSALAEWYDPPDGLAVTVVAPGSLVLSSGERMIGRFINGAFSLAMPTPFHEAAMGKYFLAEIRRHPGYTEHGATYWHAYRDLMELLLSESFHRSHGATIVWVPSGSIEEAQDFVDARNRLESAPDISSLVGQLVGLQAIGMSSPAMLLESLQLKRLIIDRVEFLAQLACVDGALVITDELRPLSFGSMLKADPWAGKVLTGPDGYEDRIAPVDLTRYGSRHFSGVAMAGACRDAAVFVVSQDGPVRGLKGVDDDTVYWWPDCLTSVFVD